MSETPRFDLAAAALEHLELLNQSNQNPLQIAAQFRTLLRSKKDHEKHLTTDVTVPNPSPPSSNQTLNSNCSNCFSYPTINWKHLRQKRYEHKLAQFLSTKFRTRDLTLSSLTTISDETDSYTYSNISTLKGHSQGTSSSSIRTPCISPIHYQPSTYTISHLNTTAIHHDDILFPIADCNLLIKHQPKRISRLSKKTICI